MARSTVEQTLESEQTGYKQTLGRRQVQMIAIGGAIGTGLFLASAPRLHSTGPAFLLSYAFVGVIAYFLMRALGELVLHRASSGAFVSYMREFFGEAGAYVTGWMYWSAQSLAFMAGTACHDTRTIQLIVSHRRRLASSPAPDHVPVQKPAPHRCTRRTAHDVNRGPSANDSTFACHGIARHESAHTEREFNARPGKQPSVRSVPVEGLCRRACPRDDTDPVATLGGTTMETEQE